jgi:hypothetical protein
MFSGEVLANPIENSQWFDCNIELIEISIFENNPIEKVCYLENGYASHQLIDMSKWLSIQNEIIPTSIDLVFTKYPIKREDWITNYYTLLANRLKALFQMDSTLNSKDIKWRFVMQTHCITESDAKNLFHGIAIKYNDRMPTALKSDIPSDLPLIANSIPEIEQMGSVFNDEKNDYWNDSSIESILYPESILKKSGKQYLPKRIKVKNEPECPKFSVRKGKPKKSMINKILRR